jgi:hypothetical protein
VLKILVSKDSLFFPPSRNGEISLFSFEVFVNKLKAPQVLKILVSKDSLFFPPSRNGEISLFSFEVFVNKWKVLQVLKILVSKDSLFWAPPPLKKWGNFIIFLPGICPQVEGAKCVENDGV